MPEPVELVPTLTRLDKRVLARFPTKGEPPKTVEDAFEAPDVSPLCPRHGRGYVHGADRGCSMCEGVLVGEAFEEFVEIANGLVCAGYLARVEGGLLRVR